MPRLLAVALCLLMLVGCTAARHQPASPAEDAYGKKIREWQERVRREGWSESSVRALLADCRDMVRYRMELKDHWPTPREFIEAGLTGDCEDIAFFLMSALRRLDYPHAVRILVVNDIFNPHALLKVETPGGRWAVFETMPGGRLEVQAARLHPILEFDEAHVDFY